MTILYFLILLSVIICIHEFGHLVAAKLFHVYCFEYSFGMGPALFQKKGKETTYSIRALPIGGFVSMAGEEDADQVYPDVKVPEGRRITQIAPWKRIIIQLAGVFMNFVLAWVIFSLVILSQGGYAVSARPEIAEIMEGSPAEEAGLQVGDLIVKVTRPDGFSTEPKDFSEMSMFLADIESDPVTYTVKRGEELIDYTITPRFYEEQNSYLIGISSIPYTVVPVNLLNCWKYGFLQCISIIKLLGQTLLRLVRGVGLNQLSGPVGIYNATEQYVSLGFVYYLLLIAQLSLNVGIFNLIPLPVLDGGQVVFTLSEWITGHKPNDKIKMGLMLITWVLLISLMLFATWNDIRRLFGI